MEKKKKPRLVIGVDGGRGNQTTSFLLRASLPNMMFKKVRTTLALALMIYTAKRS